jgi:predicted TIM-barrel fold metal-dependent hydrolase
VGAAGLTFLDGRTPPRNTKPFATKTDDDNAKGRLGDMDAEGEDIHFLIPGTWAVGSTFLEPSLTRGLHRAYHRYVADYCSTDPRRLKSQVLAMGTNPEEAARAIRQYAKEPWVAAVWPVLPDGMPVDDPDLEPIWKAASDAGLPIMYHGFTVETPYFPGYRDIWDNAAVGRCAGQTWGGARFVAFMFRATKLLTTKLAASMSVASTVTANNTAFMTQARHDSFALFATARNSIGAQS